MTLHEQRISRPMLGNIINKIYIPKFKVKRFAPYMYKGETDSTHHNYRTFQTSNISKDKQGDKSLILGIESSFDDACAAIVEGSGKVLANEKARFKYGHLPNSP